MFKGFAVSFLFYATNMLTQSFIWNVFGWSSIFHVKLIKLLFCFLIRRLEKALEKERKPFSRGMNSTSDPPNSPLECPLVG